MKPCLKANRNCHDRETERDTQHCCAQIWRKHWNQNTGSQPNVFESSDSSTKRLLIATATFKITPGCCIKDSSSFLFILTGLHKIRFHLSPKMSSISDRI